MFNKALWHGLAYVFAMLLVLSILAANLMEANRAAMDDFFKTSSTILQSEDGEGLYTTFLPKDEYVFKDNDGKITGLNTKSFLKSMIQLGRRSGYEGSVLLKNEGNTLPLSSGSSVTLLGKRSHIPILGSGMGVNAVGAYISLETALGGATTNFSEETSAASYGGIDNFSFNELSVPGLSSGAGAGFRLNNAMIAKYEEVRGSYGGGNNERIGNNYTIASINEAPASAISEVSLSGYQDAAILVFARPSAESGDFPRPAEGEASVLALTAEEKSIVEYAKANFNKIVVLISTNSQMEIKELADDPKIGAILWIGHPGCYGFLGVADILCGRVSPSGGLADTYSVSTISSPAMVNFGNYTFGNKDGNWTRNRGDKYVIEAEGLYTGYRYYESRYYDAVYGENNATSESGVFSGTGNWKYSDEMLYSFGYGLSYTNFKYEITNVSHDFKAHEKYSTFSVRVTNTGSVAGASNVQLYAQPPYKKGGIEKAAIQLVEFGKTGILAPGASETVQIEVDWQMIASYDSNHANTDGSKGTYILDNGDYYFAIGNGAHDALNNILDLQGKTIANGMDYNGDRTLAYRYAYQVGSGATDDFTFAVSKCGTRIQNQIPYADWNWYEGAPRIQYLSRSNWKDTWPKEHKDLDAPASMFSWLDAQYYIAKTDDDCSDIKWGDSSSELNFYDLSGMPYDDPRWEQILNKITLEDAITMAAYGGNTFAAAESIGFAFGKYTENTGNGVQSYTPGTSLLSDDCPWKCSPDDRNKGMSLKVFGSAPLMASSFSHDLLYAMGEFMGQECVIVGLPIIWGPGGNTHRMPYNGRTGEYYSEDAVLTGVACMEFAVGGRDNGLIASPKHYAFNDQELNRNGIAPFMTEQRAREVELRAFQIAFEASYYDRVRGEDTGMLGMMISFSKIGAVECTCSTGLIKGIAMGEWNFYGYCVTDINDDTDSLDGIIMGGCTGFDNRPVGNPSWQTLTSGGYRSRYNIGVRINREHYEKDRELQLAIKESVHRTLYVFCQSVMMNSYNSSTKSIDVLTSWRIMYWALGISMGVLTAATFAMYIVSLLKKGGE